MSARMVPIDLGGRSLLELITMALWNLDQFDVRPKAPPEDPLKYRPTPRELTLVWLRTKPGVVQELAKKAPMNRLYRVRGGVVSATRGLSPLGVIASYREGVAGGAAEAGVVVLGVKRGLGSMEKPLGVPLEGLEDVTDDARAGRLPEQAAIARRR